MRLTIIFLTLLSATSLQATVNAPTVRSLLKTQGNSIAQHAAGVVNAKSTTALHKHMDKLLEDLQEMREELVHQQLAGLDTEGRLNANRMYRMWASQIDDLMYSDDGELILGYDSVMGREHHLEPTWEKFDKIELLLTTPLVESSNPPRGVRFHGVIEGLFSDGSGILRAYAATDANGVMVSLPEEQHIAVHKDHAVRKGYSRHYPNAR